jgi:signal transduction histidine kinase
MKHMGIHTRLFLAALALIIASVILMVLLGFHMTEQFMTKRFQDRMAFLARYLALNSELAVLIRDKDTLHALSSNLLGEEDVARVAIFDEKDGSLVDVRKGGTEGTYTVERPVVFVRGHDVDLLFSSRKSQAEYEPSRIGLVRIWYTTEGIDELMANIGFRYVVSSLVVIGLSGMFLFFMSRALVKEVTALASTAQKVGEGRLHLRAELGTLPETRELASAFNAMLDSLDEKRDALLKANQEMVRQKALAEVGKFSLMVAHEVKNPLSIIKSSLEVLKADQGIAPDDPMVLYIEDEIQRLNKLIEDFLIFARPSEVKLRPVDLNELSREVAARGEYLAQEGTMKVLREIPDHECTAKADPELLTGAFWNIVKNACEATNGTGNVWVRVRHNADSWTMEVEDDGEGISEEDVDKIFEPFFTTKTKGTGLGLAFASEVISAHGGDIQAERGDMGGALFRIRIPRKAQTLSEASGR